MTIRLLSRLFASSAVALALSTAGAAHAAEFEFKFTGTDVTGDVFATVSGSNVTAVSGWITDSAILANTTFTVTGLDPYAGADNTFSTAAPYVTFAGLSFATNAGGQFNFWDNNGSLALLSSLITPSGNPSDGYTALNTLSVTAVPEPGNLALMLAGALGLFGVTRRRASR
jgi:hypothetical protein